MPARPLNPRIRALIAIGITIPVLTTTAGIAAHTRHDATQARSPVLTPATSLPTSCVPLPPINREVPQPLPLSTAPIRFAQQITTTLWSTQPPDTVGYQVMAATSPHLSDPELDHLTDVIDTEQATRPAEIGQIDLVAATGIDQATTITVTALDPRRALTLRILCAPVCALVGISR